MRASRLAATLLPVLSTVALAQPAPTLKEHLAERFYGGWMGASVAPASEFGYVTDRQLFVAALRAQYLLHAFESMAIASTIDLVPLAVLSNTPDYEVRSSRERDENGASFKTVTGRSPVLGAGFMPAGLQLYTLSTHPMRLFLGASAGLLWFTRDTPVPDARRMNISAEAGGGVEILARDGRALVIGYRFQHLSNAGTAPMNPGFDTHLVYVGVMRRRAARRRARAAGGARGAPGPSATAGRYLCSYHILAASAAGSARPRASTRSYA
jgi:hypothetical protein